MAAMFTRNKYLGWTAFVFAIQNWLSESEEQRATASQPAYMTVGMARKSYPNLISTSCEAMGGVLMSRSHVFDGYVHAVLRPTTNAKGRSAASRLVNSRSRDGKEPWSRFSVL